MLVYTFTVKPDVLFPAVLQHCRQYCEIPWSIAPSKLQSDLQAASQVANVNLTISQVPSRENITN
jgi:hypothetical protein